MQDPATLTTPKSRVLRITMIHAPEPVYASTQTYGAKFVPLWAYTLSAHIPQDGRFEVRLYDDRFQKPEIIEEADVYLYSGINQDCSTLVGVCRALRGGGSPPPPKKPRPQII
jgi:hypothetical protein